mgnify:CR=1 FL=1
MPVRIASEYALILCTSFLASKEVIHLLCPDESAMPPSKELATLHLIYGLPFSILEKNP